MISNSSFKVAFILGYTSYNSPHHTCSWVICGSQCVKFFICSIGCPFHARQFPCLSHVSSHKEMYESHWCLVCLKAVLTECVLHYQIGIWQIREGLLRYDRTWRCISPDIILALLLYMWSSGEVKRVKLIIHNVFWRDLIFCQWMDICLPKGGIILSPIYFGGDCTKVWLCKSPYSSSWRNFVRPNCSMSYARVYY